jgi:redox-sensitive bicupin YhaK (pirin superfamily)
MSAGTGILHSEKNDSWRIDDGAVHDEPVRFIQMWVVPDENGIVPGYQQQEVADEALRSGLVPVASGMAKHADDAAIRIQNRFAALYAARLAVGEIVEVPDAPFVHVFVARGAVDLEGAGPLAEGDAVRLTGAGSRRLTAAGDAEVLLWEMHATVG